MSNAREAAETAIAKAAADWMASRFGGKWKCQNATVTIKEGSGGAMRLVMAAAAEREGDQ